MKQQVRPVGANVLDCTIHIPLNKCNKTNRQTTGLSQVSHGNHTQHIAGVRKTCVILTSKVDLSFGID